MILKLMSTLNLINKPIINISSIDPIRDDEKVHETLSYEDNEEPLSAQTKYPTRYVLTYHATGQISGDLNICVQTSTRLLNACNQAHVALVFTMEPKNFS